MIISWWSGGITSAITCDICINLYGKDNVRLIFIDTFNEDEDTYRFKKDCEDYWGGKIETITGIGDKYNSIQEVWRRYNSLNVSYGAICSSELKRGVREKWEKENEWKYQAFGFDINEAKRAISIKKNHSHTNPIFPLLMYGYSKKDCADMLLEKGIKPPRVYEYGYQNNNCFKTGCVQGGVGYWQKIQRDDIDKFNAMADMEHELSDRAGKPITMLKDQSKGGGLVFLKPHPNYPTIKDISMMKGRDPEPLFECNGFCGTNDLEERKDSEKELNYQQTLF